MIESNLEQLVKDGRATIIYVHGTARSGSTIAEVVFSQLCDRAIHQPWRGILQQRDGRFRANKLEFDVDIYEAGCRLIEKHIQDILNVQSHATILVKELAGFFKPPVWRSWIKIPEKFIFTIRDPYSQYLSWLSAMTDKIYQGRGTFQENYEFVLEKAEIVEDSILPAEWEGTTITCNQNAWNASLDDFLRIREYLPKTNGKLAIIEGSLLRKEPNYVIARVTEQLGLKSSLRKLSVDNLSLHSQKRIIDIRNANRPMVKKARNSSRIEPLVKENNLNLSLLPSKSQQHLQRITPIYLDLLYAPENVSMPSLKQLDKPVTGNNLKLRDINPFLAYAIDKFYQRQSISNTKNDFSKVQISSQDNISGDSDTDNISKLRKIIDCYWRSPEQHDLQQNY